MLRILLLLVLGVSCGCGGEESTTESSLEIPEPDDTAPRDEAQDPVDSGSDDEEQAGRNTPGQCSNGALDRNESDIDCGGVCTPCTTVGERCNTDLDCRDGLLCGANDGLCDHESCENGDLDPYETDVDCGGSHCATRCGVGQSCLDDDGLGNRDRPAAENCRDRTGAKTACDPLDGTCDPPTCDDGLQNQGEAAEDCGGPCPTPCLVGQPCGSDLDCEADYVEYEGQFQVDGTPEETAPPSAACAPLYTSRCAQTAPVAYVAFDFFCSDAHRCAVRESESTRTCRRVTTGVSCLVPDVAPLPIALSECDFSSDDCSVYSTQMVYLAEDFECRQEQCIEVPLSFVEKQTRAKREDCVDEPKRPAEQSEPIYSDCVVAPSEPFCSYGSRTKTVFSCEYDNPTQQETESLESCSNSLNPRDGEECGVQCRFVYLRKESKDCGFRCVEHKDVYQQQERPMLCGSGGCTTSSLSWQNVGGEKKVKNNAPAPTCSNRLY